MSEARGLGGPVATTAMARPTASSGSARTVMRRRTGGFHARAGGESSRESRAAKPSPFLAERRLYTRSDGVSSGMQMQKYL
jgi:hypothetical protein